LDRGDGLEPEENIIKKRKAEAAAASVLSVYQDDLAMDERCDSLQSQFPESG